MVSIKVLEYYIELRLHYSDVGEGQTIKVRLDELAETLYSSRRNITRLLKSMVEEGYLRWQPGKGRGNASTIQFIQPLNVAFLYHFDDLIQQAKYKEAIRLLKKKGVSPPIRDRCYRYLMRELSIPGIPLEEQGKLLGKSSSRLRPTMVSTETGTWRMIRRDSRKR